VTERTAARKQLISYPNMKMEWKNHLKALNSEIYMKKG
jgi:hypothetical protein